jgi:GTP-binding protein HflX
MLILDIFALHAVSGEGKLQVELAQLKYTAPRLVGHGADMSRLGGGIGTRGPGESKLESDRRHMRRRISALEEQIAEMDKNRTTMRAARDRSGIPKIAIVGYTNAGKSTLLNKMTDAGILAEDKLFATLDPTTRKYELPCGETVLLTDTVGFIRKLPTHLVESFKSTLDEVREADVLLHVVDISHPQFEEQVEVVNKTLQEICDSADKPMIMVFNKVDAFTYTPKDEDDLTPRTRENISLDELKATWMSKMHENCVFISAKQQINIDELKEKVYAKAKEIHLSRFPYNDFLFQTYDQEDWDSES